MLWMLTVTVCLSAQGTAECRGYSRLYADLDACKEAGNLMIQYHRESDPPGWNTSALSARRGWMREARFRGLIRPNRMTANLKPDHLPRSARLRQRAR